MFGSEKETIKKLGIRGVSSSHLYHSRIPRENKTKLTLFLQRLRPMLLVLPDPAASSPPLQRLELMFVDHGFAPEFELMIVFHAGLVMWKTLCLATNCESPVVVVLS